MHPKIATACPKCGAPAEGEVVPEGFDDNPATFTLSITCKGRCGRSVDQLTAQQARDLTRHSYDGVTGRWSRLPTTN